jgi:hypothetical protein
MSRPRREGHDIPTADYAAESAEPPKDTVHPFDALATIGCVYLALLTFGFAAFRYLATLPVGASRNPDRTFFTSANAVSLTGFTQGTVAVGDYPALGQIVLVILAAGSALTTLIGGGYLLARFFGEIVGGSVGFGKAIRKRDALWAEWLRSRPGA